MKRFLFVFVFFIFSFSQYIYSVRIDDALSFGKQKNFKSILKENSRGFCDKYGVDIRSRNKLKASSNKDQSSQKNKNKTEFEFNKKQKATGLALVTAGFYFVFSKIKAISFFKKTKKSSLLELKRSLTKKQLELLRKKLDIDKLFNDANFTSKVLLNGSFLKVLSPNQIEEVFKLVKLDE